jgi:ABC-type lipoprotein release transport system permease subunit
MFNDENRYLFKFAWKSIRRNAGRSFFIGFAVSLAVVIAVWVVAFFDGMNFQIENAVVNTNTGHFQLQEKNYSRSTDSTFPAFYTPQLARDLNIAPVEAYSPELVLDANISTPEGAASLTVLGIDPALHARFLPISENVIAGTFLDQESTGKIVIGKSLAQVFKMNVGDQLVLNYQDQQGQLRSELLTITGIYQFNGNGFEKRFVYINQKTWQELFLNRYTGKILFHRIALQAPDLSEKENLRVRFKNSDLTIKTWKDLNPEMAVVLDFNDGMINFFFLIIGVTITMTILTPVRMMWQERYKELKMLSILGVSRTRFWKLGLSEVAQMIVLSTLFSSLVLIVIIGIQSRTGIDLRSVNNGVSIERAGILLPGVIYPRLEFYQIIATFIFVILILGISYIWSIHRTLKKLEAEI